jgi:N-acetylglucosamine-6-phosphate deacetylase
MKTLIKNADIYLESSVIKSGSLIINGNKIESVVKGETGIKEKEYNVIDAKGTIAAPGYMDSHCHGGNGFDCNDGTEEAVIGMSKFYLTRGITSYYPTTSSDPLDKIEKAFECIRKVKNDDSAGGVEILGLHMEGPFINPKHKGCQAEKYILEMTDENFKIVERNSDIIKRITIAPEIALNMAKISRLAEIGIVISGGHSDATYDQVVEAHMRGMTMTTHLFSSMSTIRKEGPYRISGMLEASLNIDTLYTEIIADRKHLPDELMQLAFKCKGKKMIMVCSDANRGAGKAEGGTIYTCGQEAIIVDGVAMVPDRSSFASSITPVDQMVRNIINYTGISKIDAINMASANIARMMGSFDRKGSIAPDKDADIVFLDNDFYVKAVMCRGKICYGGKSGHAKHLILD